MKKGWFLILVLVLLAYGCSKVNEEKPVLNELQTTACESASSNNNCDRLAELGIVTAADCCSALGKCCDGYVTGHVVDSGSLSEMQVSLNEFKVVLLGAIKSYFSSSSVLITVELKDLIYAYFSAKDEMVDLSGVGEYSKEKLIDIYNKGICLAF